MAETMREFLVGLGFRVDGNSEAKFSRAVETATKGVIALGATVAAATTVITAAVTKIAAGFDELYYASQRTKASAENIKAMGFAVSQLGGSYQGAVSSIEAFALKMRSNPGYENLARSIGVVTRQNGQLRDQTKIMEDIAKAAARMPTHVSLQYLDAFGIDEATAKAMASGEYAKRQDELRAKYKAIGADQEKAAQTGMNLSNAWRSLGATAEAFGAKLMISLGPGIGEMVKRFDDFLVRNADRIVDFFERARQFVERLLEAFKLLVEKGEGPIIEFFDTMTKGVGEMTKAFDKFAMFLAGGFLVTVLAAFASVNKGFTGMLMKLGIPAALIATVFGQGPLAEHFQEEGRKLGAKDDDVAQVAGTAKAAQSAWEATKRAWRRRPEWLGGTGGREADPAALSRRSAGGGGRNNRLTPDQAAEMAKGIQAAAKEIGVAPDDLATAISYETGGTMHPWQKGPTTQWGTHRGLIQWGEPQARKYGVTAETSITDQMKAVAKYLRDRGVKPGDSLLQIYAAINAGHASKINATDAHNGGAPGTVADKVATMGQHKGALSRLERQGGVEAPAPAPAPADGDLASEYKRKSGRDLASDREKYPEHVGGWVEQFTGKKLDAGKGFDASRFDMQKGGSALRAFDPARMARIQANAAMGQGAFGIGGPVLVPPANSNTSVDMNQKTEITILGGGDPQATAREVAGAQDKVNGGLLRNMAGAVR